MTIGDRIKAKREQLGYTQEELGRMCGTTKQTIFKYETGIVTNIPLARLDTIANKLNVSAAYLMGWEETDPQNAALINPTTPSSPSSPLSTEDEALLYAYHHATPDDKAIIDNIVSRYVSTSSRESKTG